MQENLANLAIVHSSKAKFYCDQIKLIYSTSDDKQITYILTLNCIAIPVQFI